ncbi:MAG: M23 family metallopeptidase [Bacteroidia bacterium]|nr:M23 family metallopeptidase [Bacteroidia bacterium]
MKISPILSVAICCGWHYSWPGMATITIVVIIAACERGLSQDSDALSVVAAKDWFEQNHSPFLALKMGNEQSKKLVIRPRWTESFSSRKGKWEFVESLIEGQGRFGFATQASAGKWKESENFGYLNSLSRLVVLKNNQTGAMVSFIMTIIGESEYLEKNQFKLWKNSYLSIRNDFNGLVLYHYLTGRFVNGWFFEKGETNKTVRFATGGELPIQLKTTGWYEITIQAYYQDCLSYWTVGEYPTGHNPDHWSYTENCGEIYTKEEVIIVVPTGTGTGTGTGKGTGTGTGTGSSGGYTPAFTSGTPCAGDPINNPRIASSGGTGVCGGVYGCYRPGKDSVCDLKKGFHDGTDIYAPLDSPVYAMYAGKVTFVESSVPRDTYGTAGDMGNWLYITSTPSSTTGLANPISVAYSHLNSISVTNGQFVQAGVQIGTTGSTGNAWDTKGEKHVHIQVYPLTSSGGLGTTKIDPKPYFATKFDDGANVQTPCKK